MAENSLDAIGLKYGTDKASRHHDYLNFYETIFLKRRQRPLKILEVGVLNGASLRTWREYFPKATIVGADIDPMARRWRGERVEIEYMDQSNLQDLNRVAVKHGPFDIIIEDGSHLWEHQITTLKALFPFVKPEGFYIVEDLQTNYGDFQADYRGVSSQTCVEFLKSWLDYHIADTALPLQNVEDAFLRSYGRGARSITFYKRICLIEKRLVPLPAAARTLQPLAPAALKPNSLKMGLVAHVSHVGDVYGADGYIDLGGDRFTFQGVAVEDPEAALEYRVRGADMAWTPWIASPDFAGTRGRAIALTGVTVRMREGAADRFTLKVFGKFVGDGVVVRAEDGVDCVAPGGGQLRGLQIVLTRKEAEAATES